jgi:hypothetical protein
MLTAFGAGRTKGTSGARMVVAMLHDVHMSDQRRIAYMALLAASTFLWSGTSRKRRPFSRTSKLRTPSPSSRLDHVSTSQ